MKTHDDVLARRVRASLRARACAAAAAFDAYHVCREREVTALWPRCRGW